MPVRACRFCGHNCDEHHRDRKLLFGARQAVDGLLEQRRLYGGQLEMSLRGVATVYGQTAEQTAGAARACIESCDAQIAEKTAWIATLRARIPSS